MKIINLLLAILFTTLLTGCTKEESVINDEVENETKKGTQMQLTVAMPENENPNPSTRVALNAGDAETPLNIKLTWKDGDKIYLIFVEEEEVIAKETVELKLENISSDFKKASFKFHIPQGVGDTFDLYGVHGGGGFVDLLSHHLKLPTAEQSTGASLAELSDNNAVMLKFAQKNISKASPSVSVNFTHIGSLFRIFLKTEFPNMENVTKAELYSTSAIPLHQSSGSATYNPVTGAISNTSTNGKTLAFNCNPRLLYTSIPLEFWGWFIPEANENWPWLGLKLTYNNGASVIATPNFKEARTAPLAAGKAYHFYASYFHVSDIYGHLLSYYLKFTNSAGTYDVNKFTDTRDNYEYKTVLIGNQIWLRENLKFLPEITSPLYISSGVSVDSKLYYVYDEYTSNVETAKGVTKYTYYGVLYNWLAAQTACPTGWHLPTYNEWIDLYEYLRDDDQKNLIDDDVVGNKLKKPIITREYKGATNSSEFTALMGGRLNAVPAVAGTPSAGYNAVFDNVSENGYWWSALTGDAWSLDYDDAVLRRLQNIDNQMGFSVRCIRD